MSHVCRALVAGDLVYVVGLLTIHGVYIARIYKNGIGRPNFIVDPRCTFTNDAADNTTRRSAAARELA